MKTHQRVRATMEIRPTKQRPNERAHARYIEFARGAHERVISSTTTRTYRARHRIARTCRAAIRPRRVALRCSFDRSCSILSSTMQRYVSQCVARCHTMMTNVFDISSQSVAAKSPSTSRSVCSASAASFHSSPLTRWIRPRPTLMCLVGGLPPLPSILSLTLLPMLLI